MEHNEGYKQRITLHYIVKRKASAEDDSEVFNDNFLSHHGIMGQRWGVRRFQYKNGTLTPEGVVRYRKNAAVDGGLKTGANTDGKKSDEKMSPIAMATSDIENLESAKEGKERDRAANKFLKDLNDISTRENEISWDSYLRGGREEWHEATHSQEYKDLEEGSKKMTSYILDQIRSKSGNWYEGTGVSKGFTENRQKCRELQDKWEKRKNELDLNKPSESIIKRYFQSKKEKTDKILNDLEADIGKLDRELVSVVLKDLGFPDTPQNRSYIYPYVFFD